MTRSTTLHRCLRAGMAAALVAVTAAAPRRAHAQTTPDATTAALAVFRKAQELVAEQRFGEACPLFEEVVRIEPRAIGARLQLADCYERTGRVASAWTAYSVAGDAAAAENQTERVRLAREKVEALRPKVPELTIAVGAEAQTVVGLEVKRNGVLVGNAQWGMPVPVDPGAHVVSASGTGRKPWTMTIRLEAGDKGTLEVPGLAEEPMLPARAPPTRRGPAQRRRAMTPRCGPGSWAAPAWRSPGRPRSSPSMARRPPARKTPPANAMATSTGSRRSTTSTSDGSVTWC
jgi:hypothetical protein